MALKPFMFYERSVFYEESVEVKKITWLEFAHKHDNTITKDELEFMLWEETAFPCCNLRTTVRQLLSAIRAKRNSVRRCCMCGHKVTYCICESIWG